MEAVPSWAAGMPFSWIITAPMWTGGIADTNYMLHLMLFEWQLVDGMKREMLHGQA